MTCSVGKMIVGMTDETPKPKRKHRRWIIAGVLLFVGAVTGWWMVSPKIDRRLIGGWTAFDTDPAPPDETVTFLFAADGTGFFGAGERPGGVPIAWSVSRNCLSIENRSAGMRQRVERLLGLAPEETITFTPYLILDVKDDTLRLVPIDEAENTDNPVLLTRTRD